MENEYLLQVALELKDQMSKNLEQVNGELNQFKKELKNAGVDVDNLGGRVQKNAVSMNGALASLSKKAKYTAVAITAAATMSVKSFADTEYSVKKVQTISNRSFDEIATGAYSLAKKYGGSTEDILQANYDLVSSMGDLKDGHAVLEQSAQLSMAGFTSLGGAVNALASVMNAYKMEAGEATKVSDVLMQVQNAGVTTIDELQGSLSNVLPTAASLRVRFEEIAAAMATMTSNKIPTAQATTQLNQALAELAKEGTNADKVFRQIAGESFTKFIEKGGTMVDAFDLLRRAAENNNKTLYDLFGSVEAAKAALNLTGDNIDKFRTNIDNMGKSSGTTSRAVKGLATSFKTEFDQLKAVGKEMADQFGKELIPYVRDLKKALEEVDIKELLSKENVDNAISLAKWVGGISVATWGIASAVNGVEAAIKGATYLKLLMSLVSKGALAAGGIGAAVGGIGLIGLGAYNLNSMDNANVEDLDNLKKYNDELNNQIELLEVVKKDLEKGIVNPGILDVVDGYGNLKKLLESGDIQAAIKEVNSLLAKKVTRTAFGGQNFGGEDFEKDLDAKQLQNILARNKAELKLSKDRAEALKQYYALQKDYKQAQDLGASDKELADFKKKIEDVSKVISDMPILSDKELAKIDKTKEFFKEFAKLNSTVNAKAIAFNMTGLEKAEEKVKSLESALNEGLDLNIGQKALAPIIAQYQEAVKYRDLLKEEADFKEIKKNFEKEFANMNLEFEIFGTEEKDRMLETIKVLESQVSKAISEGMLGNAREFGAELKVVKEQYKEKYELPKKAQKNLDDSMKTLSTSIYQIADVVGGKFLETVSTMINGIDVIRKSLEVLGTGGSGSGGDITGGLGSIFGNAGSFLGSESSKLMFDKIGASLAIAGAVGGMVSSIFGGSDEKRKKKNAENEKKFEENTNALKELGEQLKANTATLQDFANTLIASIATSPTLHRIAGGQNALQIMEDVMMENKDFGQLSFLVKESKKNWRGKRKSYSKNREMSENELLGLMGYDTSIGIDSFDLDQLKQFAKDLDGVTESILRGWADSLTSRKIESIDKSGLDQYKANVNEYIKQIEMLQREQKELFRNATLEGFEGINVLDEKQLTEQYRQMFTDMGIDADKYSSAIKEMVEENKVLVSSMEDVRAAFIDSLLNGEGNFTNSMGSYFQKIIKNAAMTVYDTLYSEVDNSMNEMFMKMSEKLLAMKESGNVDFTGFWNDFNFADILKAQEIESNFQLVIDDLRKQLIAMGIGEEIIDSFLPITEAQKKVNEIKDIINNGLSSAMSQALTDKNFGSFEKSLGQSIYNSVKDSLIKAFIESETYKQYIDKYFNFEEFEKELSGVTDPNKAFEMMQDYLNKLNGKLEANGMGFDDSISGNKEEDNKLGNSYYSDGPSQINITITQSFTGVYGEETMYKIAKQGTKEALEEAKNQSKVLGVM
ncbi:phage tail tape measure protein [Cetobacterium somerae]|uniref:phage tail tape measure protein n=1 Tax=Cetobacterium somerae TaxID=188913 RepID=UPI002E7BB28E|nr:phage tail tape measure protein [Cetobacterium somerae]WVJ02054.1 phage tail tape measure protein [Cetobacterium somerae]